MRMLSTRLTSLALLLVTVALAGCDTWKRADARTGRLLSFGVSTVQQDGRDLICIQTKRVQVIVDQRGGRLVDFRPLERQREPRYSGSVYINNDETPPATMPSDGTAVPLVGGVIELQPARPKLSARDYWQVDAGPAFVALLSEPDAGLRCRKDFRVDEAGVLTITVKLENVSDEAVPFTASTAIAFTQPPAESSPPGFVGTPEISKLHGIKNGWLSREVLPDRKKGPAFPADEIPAAATRPSSNPVIGLWYDIGPVTLAPGESQEWTELWSFHDSYWRAEWTVGGKSEKFIPSDP